MADNTHLTFQILFYTVTQRPTEGSSLEKPNVFVEPLTHLRGITVMRTLCCVHHVFLLHSGGSITS